MNKEEELNNLLKKVSEGKKGAIDLSTDEDLSIAVMNLVSIEEHFFFTAAKTNKDKYLDLLKEVREMRKSLLKMLIKDYEGEVWCISKHLLASSMRLMEVGTKYLGQGKKKEAKEFFNKSHELYSLFWGINLKMVNPGEIKKIDDNQLDNNDNEKGTLLGKLKGVVQKVIDCCIE